MSSASARCRIFDPGAAEPVEGQRLAEFFEQVYLRWRPELRAMTRKDYRREIGCFSRWLERPAVVADLCDDTVSAFVAARLESVSAATARKGLATLLCLWRLAWRRRFLNDAPRDLPEISPPRSLPRAWSAVDLDRLLDAFAAAVPRRGWGPAHWRALVLVVYDSGLRISAALSVPVAAFDARRRTICVAAAAQKQGAETEHVLHPQTVAALVAMRAAPPTVGTAKWGPVARQRLFPWPVHPRKLWIWFDAVCRAADLPHGPRDKFHRLRRTSYTHVYAALGLQAATDHAGHSSDLSRHYLDRELARAVQGRPSAADVLPRPGAARQGALFT